MCAGEPELAVAPAVVRAPVQVFRPGHSETTHELLAMYGAEEGNQAPGNRSGVEPVRVLFYGQHYDALVVAADDRAHGG